jgi:isopenicillin-N N-acyltransferase like protein
VACRIEMDVGCRGTGDRRRMEASSVQATATRQAVLRVVDAAGTPREIGRIHGEALRAEIALGLERWLGPLRERHGIEGDALLAEFLAATDYLPAIRRWTPRLLEEVEGIAEGADQPFDRVLSFNLLDEAWEYDKRRSHPAPGCTAACLRDGGAGAPVLAQTMDIPALHDGTQAALRLRPDGEPAAIVFTYAGMIGLNGCNAAGVGCVVNNLEVLPPSPSGLPVAFVLRGLLARRTLAAAAAFVLAVPHATGQHYAVGGPDGLRAFEGWGNGVAEVPMAGDAYLHANHPLVADDLRGDPEPAYRGSRTRERLAHVSAHASGARDRDGVQALLADATTPVSISNRGGGYMTFGAIAMELTAPPAVRIAPGPPHETPWQDVAWA